MASAKGRIVSVKLESLSTDLKTMGHALAAKNRSRVPGTGVMMLPKKETNNTYRTGIDENAPYIQRIEIMDEKMEEKERVRSMRERLQKECNIQDLSPMSKWWNYALWTDMDQNHVVPEKLMDTENIFDFSNPHKELTFRWLSVHPFVAPSKEAYERGDCAPGVMFYVYDEMAENERSYKRKQEVNEAINKLGSASPEKRKKVARLLGLPISENSVESLVYNLLDDKLKETEFKHGRYKGLSPVRMFNRFMDMNGKLLSVRYLVSEAMDYNIYRRKESGEIYEGESKIADTEEKLITDLNSNKGQEFLLALEDKVKMKKLASV